MSGRKRSQRRVQEPELLREQTEERLDQIQSTLAAELDRAKDTLLLDELTETADIEDEELVQLQQEAQFLTEQDSPEVAYATLSSLKEQGYELTETVTEAGVEATFADRDSEEETIRVSFDATESRAEDAYDEILNVYGEDDCIEFLDTYDHLMQEKGVEKLEETDITPHQGGEREFSRAGARLRDRTGSQRRDNQR
jgi:hypothetical protein